MKFLLIFSICLASTVSLSITSSFLQSSELKKPDFHFEIIKEDLPNELNRVRKCRILLPTNYYTKDNLDRLFSWYSGLHTDQDLLVVVLVYTDRARLNADVADESLGYGYREGKATRPSENQYPNRVRLYDAFFRKEPKQSDNLSERNEIYIYCPDLAYPEKTLTIVMKGKDRYLK